MSRRFTACISINSWSKRPQPFPGSPVCGISQLYGDNVELLWRWCKYWTAARFSGTQSGFGVNDVISWKMLLLRLFVDRWTWESCMINHTDVTLHVIHTVQKLQWGMYRHTVHRQSFPFSQRQIAATYSIGQPRVVPEGVSGWQRPRTS